MIPALFHCRRQRHTWFLQASLSVDLDHHCEEELHSTVPFVVWAQDKQFHPMGKWRQSPFCCVHETACPGTANSWRQNISKNKFTRICSPKYVKMCIYMQFRSNIWICKKYVVWLCRAADDSVFKKNTQFHCETVRMLICKFFYSPNQTHTTPPEFLTNDLMMHRLAKSASNLGSLP